MSIIIPLRSAWIQKKMRGIVRIKVAIGLIHGEIVANTMTNFTNNI